MKRVLVLSSKTPYPIHDGATIRTVQSVKFFHQLGYNVDLLYLSETDDLNIVKAGLGSMCHNIYCNVLTKRQSYKNVALGLLTNLLPLQVNYYYDKKVAQWVKSHEDDYDLVYCNNIRTAEYARHLHTTKILDYVDALSMNYEVARTKTQGLWKWIYTIDYYRCSRYEVMMLDEFDKKLIISKVDRNYILKKARQNKSEITVIENYMEQSDERRVERSTEGVNLVFVGAMSYEPNINAVTYFAHDIMPSIKEKYPNAKFFIVGKNPRPCVQALASESVIVTGFVDDVWDYLKQATVVVTPMLSGSGMQNKILQAMAVGASVVTTPIGFEGMIAGKGQPMIAATSAEFVKIICQLVDDEQMRWRIGNEAIEYIKENYSEAKICQKFSQFLRK